MCQEMCGSPFVALPKREKKAEPTKREKRDEMWAQAFQIFFWWVDGWEGEKIVWVGSTRQYHVLRTEYSAYRAGLGRQDKARQSCSFHLSSFLLLPSCHALSRFQQPIFVRCLFVRCLHPSSSFLLVVMARTGKNDYGLRRLQKV